MGRLRIEDGRLDQGGGSMMIRLSFCREHKYRRWDLLMLEFRRHGLTSPDEIAVFYLGRPENYQLRIPSAQLEAQVE